MTIFGVDVGFVAFPEEWDSIDRGALGRAGDGSYQYLNFGASRREFTIHLQSKSKALIDSLQAALEGDADHQATIAPDANIDLGAGAGTPITAQWLDRSFNPRRGTAGDAFVVDLRFAYLP